MMLLRQSLELRAGVKFWRGVNPPRSGHTEDTGKRPADHPTAVSQLTQ